LQHTEQLTDLLETSIACEAHLVSQTCLYVIINHIFNHHRSSVNCVSVIFSQLFGLPLQRCCVL